MVGGKKGFTIIELLAVMAIIAILVALGSKGYSLARRQAKESQAKADIEKLRTALNEYRVEYGRYPSYTGSFEEMANSLTPQHQETLTNAVEGLEYYDPWANTYQYDCTERFLYSLWSLGQDGVPGEDDIGNSP